jgi:hypothetical protein
MSRPLFLIQGGSSFPRNADIIGFDDFVTSMHGLLTARYADSFGSLTHSYLPIGGLSCAFLVRIKLAPGIRDRLREKQSGDWRLVHKQGLESLA